MARFPISREYDHLPGEERQRERHVERFPVLIGEALARHPLLRGNRELEQRFPFESWAAATGFHYPPAALPILSRCESAAEAYFVGALARIVGVGFRDSDTSRPRIVAEGMEITTQVPCGLYRIDCVVTEGAFRLAVEIDGLAFHTRKADQVSSDYLRERRAVARGYTVVRFTAGEVFANPEECWLQVRAILAARCPAPPQAAPVG